MVEEEKKRMGKMGDRVKAKADLDKAKEMAMKRIPIIDEFGRAYATGVSIVPCCEHQKGLLDDHTFMAAAK